MCIIAALITFVARSLVRNTSHTIFPCLCFPSWPDWASIVLFANNETNMHNAELFCCMIKTHCNSPFSVLLLHNNLTNSPPPNVCFTLYIYVVLILLVDTCHHYIKRLLLFAGSTFCLCLKAYVRFEGIRFGNRNKLWGV